ncbi:hypothetical protein ACFYYB_20945 [Streptomyces sp. NPDC002886]|uniref:hypothetical protein n=1 Tax=Streptomyces sp. NPDC002886 TaxID=3364667 RepID=UPI0036C2A326
MDAWLEEAGRDRTGHAHAAARSAVFDAVRRDADGPEARRLASLATEARGDARLWVLRLLTELTSGAEDRTAAARTALPLLADPDPPVRRAAAWLLAAADRAGAVEILTAPGDDPGAPDPGTPDLAAPDPGVPDPVARLALAEALLVRGGDGLVERLRGDADPAVRLRAAPAPEGEAVLEDRDAAGSRIAGPGSLVAWRIGTVWGMNARRSVDESTCYAWVARLAARPTEAARLAAVDLAAEAMRHWRAAPAALVPHLRPLLADPVAAPAAVRVLGASLEAARLCREELAEPGPARAEAATLALARIGDVRALPELCRVVRAGASGRQLGEAARGLAEVPGTDLAPLVEAAAAAVDLPGPHDAGRALTVLSACGAAAAHAVPVLVRLLTELPAGPASGRGDGGPHHQRAGRLAGSLIAALGAIGPAAAPALPLLDSLPENGPGTRGGQTAMALIRISGDRRRAEETLGGLGDRPRDIDLAARILEWLADHGGLEPHHLSRLRANAADAERAHPRLLATLWLHAGDEPTGPSLDAFLDHVVRDGFGLYVCRVLGSLGPAAAPALSTLRAVAEQSVRVPMYFGDQEEEMREDERLAEAVRNTLRRIDGLRTEGPGPV